MENEVDRRIYGYGSVAVTVRLPVQIRFVPVRLALHGSVTVTGRYGSVAVTVPVRFPFGFG